MAKKKQSKFQHYIRITVVFLGITLIIATLIFALTIGGFLGKTGETVVFTNDWYTLKGNPNSYQKELFKELTNEINKGDKADDRLLAALLVENFIADYYTWNNKLGTYDVGGKDFIYYKEFTNFDQTSRRYFMIDMGNYLSKGIAIADLNEVESITITFADHSNGYDYYGTNLESYYVTATWTYKANDKIDTSVFQNAAEFTVIKSDDGRYAIAQFY